MNSFNLHQPMYEYMRATVIYNENAGFGGLSYSDISAALSIEGYHTSCYALQDESFPRILHEPCEMVIAVGGDGTVKTVLKELAGSKIPVHIWPTGTSNNIAASCGIINAYRRNSSSAQIHKIHLPKCSIAGYETVFAESVGVGLLANMMREMKFTVPYRNAEEKINKSLVLLKKLLKETREYELRLLLDGEHYSGKYLAVEVMNTRLAGPKLLLAPGAELSDGEVDVVLISRQQAKAMETYFGDRLAGLQRPPALPVYKAKRVEINGEDLDFHIDDEFGRSSGQTSMQIYGDNTWVYVV